MSQATRMGGKLWRNYLSKDIKEICESSGGGVGVCVSHLRSKGKGGKGMAK